MTEAEMIRKIAYQEFLQDQLSAELEGLDELLKATGFPRGIQSVKEVALEMLEEESGNSEFKIQSSE